MSTVQKADNWLVGKALYVSGAGLQWSGRGSPPRWLREELERGESRLEYLNPTHRDYAKEKTRLERVRAAAKN